MKDETEFDRLNTFVVMRSDYTSVLSRDNGWILCPTYDIALKTAENFSGIAVSAQVADDIIKLNLSRKQEIIRIVQKYNIAGHSVVEPAIQAIVKEIQDMD